MGTGGQCPGMGHTEGVVEVKVVWVVVVSSTADVFDSPVVCSVSVSATLAVVVIGGGEVVWQRSIQI